MVGAAGSRPPQRPAGAPGAPPKRRAPVPLNPLDLGFDATFQFWPGSAPGCLPDFVLTINPERDPPGRTGRR